ncbi:MAG TPA: hypothetical protein VJJ79_03180 [Candidatus Nanoarchaeia archaeon]|nr:hypothetical protein [Candidatus Nanoarchaeia archaeon]
MDLEDAVRCALRDETFYENMLKCLFFQTTVGSFSFVQEEERKVFAGNVAQKLSIPGMLSPEELPRAASEDLGQYTSGYLLKHPIIGKTPGFVFLSKWLFFDEGLQRSVFRAFLKGKVSDPLVALRTAGLQPSFEDYLQLNQIRDLYQNVALIRGYTTESHMGEFPFVISQQLVPLAPDELRYVHGRTCPKLDGYYRTVVGKRFRDGSVHFASSSDKKEALTYQ